MKLSKNFSLEIFYVHCTPNIIPAGHAWLGEYWVKTIYIQYIACFSSFVFTKILWTAYNNTLKVSVLQFFLVQFDDGYMVFKECQNIIFSIVF